MNKKAIIITVSSLLLLGAGVGVFLYFNNKSKDKKDKEDKEEEDFGATKDVIEGLGGGVSDPDASEYSTKMKMVGSGYPLKIGSKGRRVALLQALLNYNGADISVDGALGNQTRTALFKDGFLKCSIAKFCEVTKVEYGEMVKDIKDKESFKRQYNINVNPEMKAVWDKYKS